MANPTTAEKVRITSHFTLNSVDLSNWVRSISGPVSERNAEEFATVGTGDDAEYALGRASKSFTVTFIQDFYASKVWATLRTVHNAAAGAAFIIGPKGSASGDPKITGTCLLPTDPGDDFNYNAISAITATFQATGAVTYTTFSP